MIVKTETPCVNVGFIITQKTPNLYNGDRVQIVSGIIGGKDGHNYVVVHSPKLGKQGYVNAAYVR